MKHKHHIIPRHMGGTDDPSNLVELTRKEHAMAHMKLYEQYGKKEDLGAYYLNAKNGHMKRVQKLSNPVEAGKKGGAATMASGKGAFGDPIQRLESCRKGGKTQGKINAQTGHLKKISALSKRTSGKIWLTDGSKNMMINPEEQIPEGFFRGKTQTNREE
jgi:hypothetical protein